MLVYWSFCLIKAHLVTSVKCYDWTLGPIIRCQSEASNVREWPIRSLDGVIVEFPKLTHDAITKPWYLLSNSNPNPWFLPFIDWTTLYFIYFLSQWLRKRRGRTSFIETLILTSLLCEMLMITGGWWLANCWQIGQVTPDPRPDLGHQCVTWPVLVKTSGHRMISPSVGSG